MQAGMMMMRNGLLTNLAQILNHLMTPRKRMMQWLSRHGPKLTSRHSWQRRTEVFGKAAGKGSSDGCHICGHPGHYARDCPDRQAPKGKGRMYHMGYYEDDSLYAFQKGKGKSKGKYGKNMHLMDELFYMRGKGFGNNMKGKGKGKTKNTGVVNAYYADYEEPYGYHVLDFKEEVFRSSSSSHRNPTKGCWDLFGLPWQQVKRWALWNVGQRSHMLSRTRIFDQEFGQCFAEAGQVSEDPHRRKKGALVSDMEAASGEKLFFVFQWNPVCHHTPFMHMHYLILKKARSHGLTTACWYRFWLAWTS